MHHQEVGKVHVVPREGHDKLSVLTLSGMITPPDVDCIGGRTLTSRLLSDGIRVPSTAMPSIFVAMVTTWLVVLLLPPRRRNDAGDGFCTKNAATWLFSTAHEAHRRHNNARCMFRLEAEGQQRWSSVVG